jgi:hypothetical protein
MSEDRTAYSSPLCLCFFPYERQFNTQTKQQVKNQLRAVNVRPSNVTWHVCSNCPKQPTCSPTYTLSKHPRKQASILHNRPKSIVTSQHRNQSMVRSHQYFLRCFGEPYCLHSQDRRVCFGELYCRYFNGRGVSSYLFTRIMTLRYRKKGSTFFRNVSELLTIQLYIP